MSNETLQTLAVAAIVAGAIAFLVWRRVRRKARPSPLCGDCPACTTTARERDDWGLVGSTFPRAHRAAKRR